MNLSLIKNSLTSPWFVLAIVLVTAAIIYSNIYHSPFVFDDTCQIVEKTSIRYLENYLSFEQLLKPRAVVDLTFALNYKFGKLNVFGYHLVNVFIHILNGFIVYFLATLLFTHTLNPRRSSLHSAETGGPQSSFTILSSQQISLMSLFAALIFIAHPIQTQAVTYTVQRYASMAAMFYMASVLFYLKARITEDGKRRTENGGQRTEDGVPSAFYLLSIFCGILAFLSKQNTASLPGAILLVEYLFVDRTWQGWKRKIPWFSVGFTLWFLFVLYVSGFFSAVGGSAGTGLLEDVSNLMQETDTVSRWSYLCTQFNVLVIYIRLLFLPVGQNLDYLYSFKSGFFDGYTPLAFLFLIGVVGMGIWNIKKRPVIAFGIFWFFITLSVESSIIPIRDALFEHRLYLATFGFALIVSYLPFGLLLKKQVPIALFSVCIVLALGVTTYCRNIVWQEEMRLWSDVVSKNPKSCRGWNGLGNAFLENDKPLEAIEQYIKALNNQPNYAVAWYNWGNALLYLDKPIEAIQKYQNALTLQPGYADVWCNWGNALVDLGKTVEAIRKFREALNNRPGYAKAWYNWGNALVEINRSDEAVDKFEKAIGIDPDYTKALGSLGAAYLLKQKTREAAGLLEKAVRLNPEYAEAWCNLGIALGMMGKLNQAISKIEKAVNIKPDYVDGWLNWGAALVKMGMFEDAIEKYQNALSLNPEMPKARNDIDAINKIIESRKKNRGIAE